MRSSDPPSGSHIREDIEVEGVLRIGDNCVCEGDLIATAGIILGDGVTVRGDIFTDGSVQVGHGCRILGEIRPVSQASGRAQADRSASDPDAPEPGGDPEASDASEAPEASDAPEPSDTEEELAPSSPLAPGSASGQPPGSTPDSTPQHNVRLEPSPELKSSALRSTLEALLMLAWNDPERRPDESVSNRWGLREDALEDLLEGAYTLIIDLYRDGKIKRPWGPSDVIDILLRQVAPLIVPTSVQADGTDRARLRVRRPPLLSRDEDTTGWPEPTMALLEALLQTVRPSCRIDPVDPAQVLDQNADPDEVTLIVRTR